MRKWILGARLRTLPAGICPVIGAFLLDLGLNYKTFRPLGYLEFLLCFLTALFMQLFANFANDYSDGIKGTDEGRKGGEGKNGKPPRLFASGAASRKELLGACVTCALLCALFGTAACSIAKDFWLLLIGLACFFAGWFYVGGKRPYGYIALGEISVLVFFGFVDTMGSGYLIAQSSSLRFDADLSAILSICFGFGSVSILTVNNLRDKRGDQEHGKITLAVLFGQSYVFFLPIFLFFSFFAFAFLLGCYRLFWLIAAYAICDLFLIFLSCRAVAEMHWKKCMRLLSSRLLLVCIFLAVALT